MAFYEHDFVPDSPINNFATIDALDTNSTLSEGNLKAVTAGNNYRALCNFPITEGKWYYEFAFHSGDPAQVFIPEYFHRPNSYTNNGSYHSNYYEAGLVMAGGYGSSIGINLWGTGNWGTTAENNEYNSGTNWKYEVAGIYLEHTGTDLIIYAYRNGVLRIRTRIGSAFTYPRYYFGYKYTSTWPASIQYYNFGQDAYLGGKGTAGGSYADSAGYGQFNYKPVDENGANLEFYSLCTKNIPSGPINVHNDDVPSDYFKAVTWSGDGSSSMKIPVGFSPDLIVIKSRNITYHPNWWDSVRGFADGKSLTSDQTWEQGYITNVGHPELDPNDDKAFLAKADSTNHWATESGINYVAWCFRSAGRPVNDGDAKIINEDGTQADTTCAALASAATSAGASNVVTPSKVSANRKSGFSILKFSRSRSNGQTVPHGLTSAPEFMILKETTNSSGPWVVYHKNLSSAANHLLLHSSNQEGSTNAYFNSTHPNSSVFTLGDASTLDSDVICYLWHSVPGYSKISSYVGNGSADGPYVECGFRVGWLMVKLVSTTTTVGGSQAGSWGIFDNQRSPYNFVSGSNSLWANQSAQEGVRGNGSTSMSGWELFDFVSNGFKVRNSGAEFNISGENFIYAAFAEAPANAPANAR